jgi:transcriptional regulator with XRE-family HTH domain
MAVRYLGVGWQRLWRPAMIRNALQLIRLYHDLTPAQIALQVGLSESDIVGLEKGKRKITLAIMEKYAAGFDIPLSSLMLFAEQETGIYTADSGSYVAEKVILMLDWLAAISAVKRRELQISIRAMQDIGDRKHASL